MVDSWSGFVAALRHADDYLAHSRVHFGVRVSHAYAGVNVVGPGISLTCKSQLVYATLKRVFVS